MTDQLRNWTSSEQSKASKITSAWESFFKTDHPSDTTRSAEIAEAAKITEIQEKHESELLARDGVVGVAISNKVKAGKPGKARSLTVYVESKKKTVAAAARIPAKIDGVVTDVVEVGEIKALAFTARLRPAVPGFSIGHTNITAGTFGYLVQDIRRCCCESETCCCGSKQECKGNYLILSNNHILAAENSGKPGDLILQPGPLDGGVYPSDSVATLERFEPIVFGRSGYNLVDAAVARPTHSRNVTASIIGQIMPRGVDQAFTGSQVIKAGRTTEVTSGRVTAVNATIAVGYSSGSAVFRHQIITTPMGAPGDSGSLLMDADLNAIGLLFAGSSALTIFNHIADVEVALGVRPVTAPRST